MSSAVQATDPVLIFRANRERYQSIGKAFSHPLVFSESVSRLFYSLSFRASARERIAKDPLEHPKRKHAQELTAERLKTLYANSNSIFMIPDGPFENPPVHTLKLARNKDTQYFDMGGAYFSRPDPFKHFARFASSHSGTAAS
jgi:hypothetical protein